MKLREKSNRIIARVMIALMLITYLPNIFGGAFSVNAAPEDDPETTTTEEEYSSKEVTSAPTSTDAAEYNPNDPFGTGEGTSAVGSDTGDSVSVTTDGNGVIAATVSDADEEPQYHVTQDTERPAFEAYKNLSEWTSRKSFDAPERTYSLEVCTGAKEGDTVLYFAIHYKDTNSVSRTHFLFPHVDGFSRSNALLSYYAPDKDSYNKSYGSKLAEELHYSQTKNASAPVLGAWTIQDFAFQTEAEMATVEAIDIYLQSGTYNCTGISVYKMEKYKGLEDYGMISGQQFLDFEGELIADTVKKSSAALNGGGMDTLIVIGGKYDSSKFTLRTGDQLNETNSDKSGGGTEAVASKPKKSFAGEESLYSFRMDLADVANGGLESFLNTDGAPLKSDNGIVEDIALQIQYKDIHGWNRKVVLPFVLNSYAQARQVLGEERILGFGQRGDTIAFQGVLPECASFVSDINVSLGNTARSEIKTAGNITEKSTTSKMKSSLSATASDYINLSGISIYKGGCMPYTLGGTDSEGKRVSGATIYYAFENEDNPQLYYTTTKSDGRKMVADSTDTIRLSTFKAGSPIVATPSKGEEFLVTVKTSDIEGAGSNSDISVRFGYRNLEGVDNNTNLYKMKEAANDYMGKWPTVDGGNYIDATGLVAGGSLSFIINAENLMDFTGIEINVGSDSWTLKNITIAYIESYDKRAAYYNPMWKNNASTNYWIERNCVAVDVFSLKGTVSTITDEEGNTVDNSGEKKKQMRYKTNEKGEILEENGKPVLEEVPEDEQEDNGVTINTDITLKPQSTYRISFTSDTTNIDVRTTKYSEVRYSMTWDQTQVNWGFFKKRKIFDVAVKVAEDSDHDTGNGDSGSSNYFHFQLIFKNGNSGYVLANQQITSDGFRSGYTENFTIATNQNYGELKGVRIIPEQNSDDAEPFDKLNIEQITVSEENNGGCYTSYIIGDVGWIDIDYHDELESIKPGGQKARTANQLSKIYKVSDRQKNVKLVCEISAEPWSGTFAQFEGSMKAEILYTRESTGVQEPITIDVVQCMGNYMGRNVKSIETETNPKYQVLKEAGLGTMSDKEYMFRPNHTDRLLLPAIPDLRSIDSITFTGQNLGKEGGAWCIKNISILQVIEDGAVQLTTNNEFYRNISYRRVCMSTNTEPKEQHWIIGGKNSLGPFEFNSNRIIWNEEDDWATPVSRLPDSTDDRINMFVYPEVGSTNSNGASVNATLKYNIPFSQYKTLSQSNLTLTTDASGRSMYMAKDLSAPDFVSTTDFKIYCKSSMTFDYAIIQHVREGVVISNYVYDFIGASAELGATGFGNTKGDHLDATEEHVAVGFGAGSKEKILMAEKVDAAISFDYKSSLDGATYQSPYIYLTDQGYKKTEAGLSAELDFDVPFVSEITQYHIAGYGSLEANITGAAAVTYAVERKMNIVTAQMEVSSRKRRSYASFAKEFTLVDKVSHIKRTSESAFGEDSVAVFEMKITTLESTAMKDTGTKASVRMKFHYNDSKGLEVPDVEYEDITQYIQGDAKNAIVSSTKGVPTYTITNSDEEEASQSDANASTETETTTVREKKQFFSGETQSVKVFLNNINEDKIIRSIDILPYNANVKINAEDAQVAESVADKSTEQTVADAVGDAVEGDTSNSKADKLANQIIASRNESWTIKDFYGYYMGYDEEVDDIIKKPGINKTFDGLDNGGTLTLMDVTLRTTFKKNNGTEETVKDNLATIYAERGDVISGSVIARAGKKSSNFEVKASLMIGDAPKDVTKETVTLSDNFYFSFKTPRNNTDDVVVYKIEISVKDAPEYVDTILVNVPNSSAIKMTTTVAKNDEQAVRVDYGMAQLWASDGDTIYGSVVLEGEGADRGFTVNSYLVADKETDITKDTTKKSDDYHFEFKVPEKGDGKTYTYKIKVASVADPDLYDTIVISVKSEKKKKVISLKTNVSVNSGDSKTVSEGNLLIPGYYGDDVLVYVTVNNSDQGYKVSATQSTYGNSWRGGKSWDTKDISSSISPSGNSFTFTVPDLSSSSEKSEFKIMVSSVEDSSLVDTIVITASSKRPETIATPAKSTLKTSVALNSEKGTNVSDGLMSLSAVVGDQINGSVLTGNTSSGFNVTAELTVNASGSGADALGLNVPQDITGNYVEKYKDSFRVIMPPYTQVYENTTATVRITISLVDDPTVQDVIIVTVSPNSDGFTPQTTPIQNPDQP